MFAKYLWKYAVAVVLSTLLLVSCGDPEDAQLPESPDDRDETAFSGGKADSFYGRCELTHMVLLANEADTDADALTEAGLHTRAANNIEDFRAGTDEELGTDDDRYFQTVEEIDDVYYVGPVAMEQLAGAVEEYCADDTWREAETVFSPRPYDDSHIGDAVEMIDSAEESIDMAMYNVSDNQAFEALEDAVDRGVDVRLLYDGANGDHLDVEGSRSARLEELGADVRYINRVMHHKFFIVDGPQEGLLGASDAQLLTGSANLSYGAATQYDENVTFHRRDPSLVLLLQREFNHLWENSRDIDWNEELEYFETAPIAEEAIPANDDLEVLLTSENFETYDSTRWGPGFRPIDFKQSVADRLVELIEEADSSIWVAADFLRSRPVSEALIRRWNEDPELDIRIYLDQTEYISQWYHGSQEDDLEDCLDEAGDDEEEVFECEQSGFIFSYDFVAEEIPTRFKTYSFRWHYSYAKQMHQKYMIFDETTVATGSYNFSHNAEQNTMENVVVYRNTRYPSVAESFVDNFDEIWETGHDENRYQEFMSEVETADEIDLVFEPMALTHGQVADLRDAIRERCPQIDSEPFRTSPEDHYSCEAQ